MKKFSHTSLSQNKHSNKLEHQNKTSTHQQPKKREEKWGESEEKQTKRTMTFGISKETQKVAAMEERERVKDLTQEESVVLGAV